MKNRDRISVVVAYQVDRGLFPWLFSSASEQTTPYRTGIAPSAHSSTLRYILTFCIPLLIPSRAALVLGCTRRTINRLIIRYHQEGKAAFRHGNKGRKPSHTIPDSVKESIRSTVRKQLFWCQFYPFSGDSGTAGIYLYFCFSPDLYLGEPVYPVSQSNQSKKETNTTWNLYR